MKLGIWGRSFAACIAAVAWTGLAIQLSLTYSKTGSIVASLWLLVAFFTIVTNLLVAVLFTVIACNRGRFLSESIVVGMMLSIVMVGVVNALLLQGALELSGGSGLVDKLLHVATPALVPIFWILYGRKGRLVWIDPVRWAIYPLVYLLYDMARGAITGKYAYPFLDVGAQGWSRTTLNALAIFAGFMVVGFGLVWADHFFGSRSAKIQNGKRVEIS
jgi:hypothetical protein